MIESDQVVSIHYTLTTDAGEVLDSSEGRDPLKYLHGHQNIVPGLESALAGKVVGDKFDVVVSPEEGYGVRDESRVAKIPRSEVKLPDLEPGMMLQAQTSQGPMILKVVEVGDEDVTVDANHELAGVTLHFAVEVIAVRPAEPEEIDHGHVH